MPARPARLSLGFSCLGHTYAHLSAPIFFVVALTLEEELGLTHGETVALIIAGNVLYGLAAPLAGWLGDRWSTVGMMGLFFLGTGGGMVAVGFADTPFGISLGLAVAGLFGSIFHPVGIAWLVRNAVNRGLALGVSGFFGGVGPAIAALMAGALTQWFGWRSAFVVPGVVILATGVVFYLLIQLGLVVESKVDRKLHVPASRRDAMRAFVVMFITMICAGLIYHATQAGLPKVFSERLVDLVGDGIFGVGAVVAVVYIIGGATQMVAGFLADRFPLKTVYVLSFVLQVPLLFLAANLAGPLLVVVVLAMVSANWGSQPAENSLVAAYAPSRWRGFVFGIKFVLAFTICGVGGVKLEGVIYDLTGGFEWLFVVLSAIAAVGAVTALLLPQENSERAREGEET